MKIKRIKWLQHKIETQESFLKLIQTGFVWSFPQPLFLNPYSAAPVFQKIFQPAGQSDRQPDRQLHGLLPPQCFRINFLLSFNKPLALSLSTKFVEFYGKQLYIPPWLEKNLKIMVFKLLGNAIAIQKIESRHFYSSSFRQSSSPGSYNHPIRQKKMEGMSNSLPRNIF